MTRLIDADALKNTFKDKEGNEFTAFHFYDAIDNAPTIERPHGEWTKESAIDYLTEIGWLPEHDRILTDRPHGEEI